MNDAPTVLYGRQATDVESDFSIHALATEHVYAQALCVAPGGAGSKTGLRSSQSRGNAMTEAQVARDSPVR